MAKHRKCPACSSSLPIGASGLCRSCKQLGRLIAESIGTRSEMIPESVDPGRQARIERETARVQADLDRIEGGHLRDTSEDRLAANRRRDRRRKSL
jgi:hypothetical protein